MIAPARLAAYRAVRAVESGRANLASAIAAARASLADERDRALATDLATGTLRWRGQLDQVIVAFTRRPLTRLDAEIVDILRIAAYQLLHLDRVPASAAVSDAVELARLAGKRSAAGFVNAVLRSIVRRRHRLPLPVRPDGPIDGPAAFDVAVEYVSVALSHPRWLVERWIRRYGFEAAEVWARFNNSSAPLTLRVNRLRTSPDDLVARLREAGVAVRTTRYAPDALEVTDGNPLNTPLAEAGLFVVQDEASQLVALLADARPGERVLDACASPGGKTTAMAAAMEDRGLLVAADLRPRRVRLLRRTVGLSGATCVRLAQIDLRAGLPFSARFDCVLVDAPCSGLGTIRRDPDIRWRRSDADLPDLAAAELALLRHAAEGVRPGGRLVYATCSSEPEENEQVVDRFLSDQPAFTSLDPRDARQWRATPPAAVIDDRGHLRTYPHVHGLEAFFGAAMRRGG